MLLLVVVAHPDDESFGCGSVLAARVAPPATTRRCCAPPAARQARAGSAPTTWPRSARRSCARRPRILGVGTVRAARPRRLRDGRRAGAGHARRRGSDDGRGARCGRVIDELRPDVVVTLDASDGHRDHAAIRDATLAAVDTAGAPTAATYLWCLARSSMTRWATHMRETAAARHIVAIGELGTPDDEITTVVDVDAVLPTRWEAIRAHASQASPYDELPRACSTSSSPPTASCWFAATTCSRPDPGYRPRTRLSPPGTSAPQPHGLSGSSERVGTSRRWWAEIRSTASREQRDQCEAASAHLIGRVERLSMPDVVDEVRDRIHEPRPRGCAHERPGQPDRRGNRHHCQREVQHSDVANEVLVERPIGSNPRTTRAREVVVEPPRREARPQPDDDRGHAHQHEQDAKRALAAQRWSSR